MRHTKFRLYRNNQRCKNTDSLWYTRYTKHLSLICTRSTDLLVHRNNQRCTDNPLLVYSRYTKRLC